MRYAILSDIHSNLPALIAVLTDIRSSGIDEIICLGDIIGYGPEPAEVLELTHSRIHHFVLGNHDAVICGKLNPDCFTDNARTLIDWTASRLDRKAADFFGKIPLVLKGKGFVCVHGTAADPGRFGYILDGPAALEAWEATDEQLLFVGHTHVPGIYVVGTSGTPHWLDPRGFSLEPGKRYIVNVGSAGQPRDGDVRASYCTYDVDSNSIHFRRVPFDVDQFRERMTHAGLSPNTVYFLKMAESDTDEPLRDLLDFHPPEGNYCDDDIQAPVLEETIKTAVRWRFRAGLLLVVLIVVAACAAAMWLKRPRQKTVYGAYGHSEYTDGSPPLGSLLSDPEPIGRVSGENCLAEWTVELTDPDLQMVQVVKREGDKERPVQSGRFVLKSEQASEMALVSRPFTVDAGTRFEICASLKPVGEVRGHLELCLAAKRGDGTDELLVHYPVERFLDEQRWKYCHKTSHPRGLARKAEIRWRLQGEFIGEVMARGCDLKRLE